MSTSESAVPAAAAAFSAAMVLGAGLCSAAQAETFVEYPDFYPGEDGAPEDIVFETSVSVLTPAYGSYVKGPVTVVFRAPGMRHVKAFCWGGPEDRSPWGDGRDVLLAELEMDGSETAEAEFVFPADAFPNGPTTIRIHAKDDTNRQDICELQLDPYVRELISYRYYPLFGKMLPGDMSAYQNIRHVIPNFQITYADGEVKKQRFWPTEQISTELLQSEYKDKIRLSSEILHNSLQLVGEKWPGKAAISLTGGCDSKTTLACANGLYDNFNYFSYVSSEAERVDAEAAKEICQSLMLKHRIYQIPEQDSDFQDTEIWRAILRRNCGEIGENNANDVRKRIYFTEHHDFDVEVKSWVSEIVRAYYNKRFMKKNFPPYPTARYLTAMYKVFLGQRRLVRQTDQHFQDYLDEYYTKDVFDKVNWTDLIFWEYRVSSWNGLVISNEHSLSFDITIPYNNRILLQTLLGTPLEGRIHDQCHKDIQKLMNQKIADSGISVTNLKHTERRARAEKFYLAVQTRIPF